MASLSQALRLGDLPPPHRTFQGHATHIREWSMMLRPNDSWSTCIPQGIATFLHYASRRSAGHRYTAHPEVELSAHPPRSTCGGTSSSTWTICSGERGPDFSVVLYRPNCMLVSEKHPMKIHKNQWLLTPLSPPDIAWGATHQGLYYGV